MTTKYILVKGTKAWYVSTIHPQDFGYYRADYPTYSRYEEAFEEMDRLNQRELVNRFQ